tara:strand:+ start:26755 stop:26970 length:216 start_codon:yes stop_codon:yes gene_type:complete
MSDAKLDHIRPEDGVMSQKRRALQEASELVDQALEAYLNNPPGRRETASALLDQATRHYDKAFEAVYALNR